MRHLSSSKKLFAELLSRAHVKRPRPIYRELQPAHFRLLRYTGTINHILCFSLTDHAIDKAPAYVALSYTWGAPEDATFIESPLSSRIYEEYRSINVNGHAFEVRLNLYEFFLHMQADDQHRTFWIDAICINQDNTSEKTKQVNHMDTIYHQAESVLVWLGRANDFTNEVIEMSDKLSTAMVTQRDKLVAISNPFHADCQDLLGPGMSHLGIDAWLALFIFYQRSWFSRVWTYQEIALARDIVCRCGTHDITWQSIENVSKMLPQSGIGNFLRGMICSTEAGLGFDTGGKLVNNIAGASMTQASGHSAMRVLVSRNINELATFGPYYKTLYNESDFYSNPVAMLDFFVSRAAGGRCFDPRDHVFGILGTAKQAAKLGPGPKVEMIADYSLNTVDLYTNLMSLVLSETAVVSVLCRAGLRQMSGLFDLPSWVTDFSNPAPSTFIQIQLVSNDSHGPFYDASRQSAAGFSVRGRQLHLHHHPLATITQVADTYVEMCNASFEKTIALMICRNNRHGLGPITIDDIWQAMTTDIKSMSLQYYSDEVLRLAFRQFLTMQCFSRFEQFDSKESKFEALAALDSLNVLANLDDSNTVLPPSFALEMTSEDAVTAYEESLPFTSITTWTMVRRTLFLLDDGRIGLGPDNMEPGDVLSIVADGGRTPLIFRRAHAEDNKWTLIGEAYVRGLMYGEGVDQMEAEGKSWEKICVV